MSAGAAVGAARDVVGLGLQEDFIAGVSTQLDPGKVALIVEVDESSTEPIDSAIARRHGRVYRSDLTSA